MKWLDHQLSLVALNIDCCPPPLQDHSHRDIPGDGDNLHNSSLHLSLSLITFKKIGSTASDLFRVDIHESAVSISSTKTDNTGGMYWIAIARTDTVITNLMQGFKLPHRQGQAAATMVGGNISGFNQTRPELGSCANGGGHGPDWLAMELFCLKMKLNYIQNTHINVYHS